MFDFKINVYILLYTFKIEFDSRREDSLYEVTQGMKYHQNRFVGKAVMYLNKELSDGKCQFMLCWYHHPVVCVFIFRPRNQLLEHNAFICHLLHVSAVFGYCQVFFTATYVEKHTEVEAFPSQLITQKHKFYLVIHYKGIIRYIRIK